jgi:RimJ/RimL family protein N-acetyltransferase
MSAERLVVEWRVGDARLRLVEPTTEEVRAHAATLAECYNEPRNRALLTNEHEFAPEDVVEQFDEMRRDGGRPFLLFSDDAMMGDCDLRHVEGSTAEFAIMVGAREHQARGLGTRFATMLHALAFGRLGMKRVYATVRPENAGSRRMLEKVGYVLDESPEARRFADAEDDVCVSVDAASFARAQGSAIAAVQVRLRATHPTT